MIHQYKEIIKEERRKKSFTGHLIYKLFVTMFTSEKKKVSRTS